MKTLSVRSDRPLDPITVEVLSAVDSVARELAIGYFVAGAMARDIVLLNAAQRVYYASIYPVDLVPFGGVVENDGNLVWPPERAIVMNVLGCDEALAASLKVEVEPGTVVPVASLASLGMLKVFAWVDRGTRDRKDAQDLALLLRRYADTIDPDHLYGSEAAVLEAVDYDYLAIAMAQAWRSSEDPVERASQFLGDFIAGLSPP